MCEGQREGQGERPGGELLTGGGSTRPAHIQHRHAHTGAGTGIGIGAGTQHAKRACLASTLVRSSFAIAIAIAVTIASTSTSTGTQDFDSAAHSTFKHGCGTAATRLYPEWGSVRQSQRASAQTRRAENTSIGSLHLVVCGCHLLTAFGGCGSSRVDPPRLRLHPPCVTVRAHGKDCRKDSLLDCPSLPCAVLLRVPRSLFFSARRRLGAKTT